jgi:hypothetical protein
MLHDNQRYDSRDKFFICGGNPDGSGGGLIGSRDRWDEAVAFKLEAIKQNYTRVRIYTWIEMMG